MQGSLRGLLLASAQQAAQGILKLLLLSWLSLLAGRLPLLLSLRLATTQ